MHIYVSRIKERINELNTACNCKGKVFYVFIFEKKKFLTIIIIEQVDRDCPLSLIPRDLERPRFRIARERRILE